MERESSEGFVSKPQIGNLVRINTEKLPEILKLYESSRYGFLNKIPRLR